jgi:hypothetical protein
MNQREIKFSRMLKKIDAIEIIFFLLLSACLFALLLCYFLILLVFLSFYFHFLLNLFTPQN